MIKGLTLPQILNATAALAQLHGWSLITNVNWRDHVPDFQSREPVYKQCFSSVLSAYQTVKDAYPDHFGSMDVEKLKTFLTFDNMVKYGTCHHPHMEDVLVHGDYWANNIMFEKDPDGTVGDSLVAIVDWQLSIR